MSEGTRVRLFVAGRRKPGMTRREHANHRFDVHAALTYGPDKFLRPILYSQNHIVDAALGAPAGHPNLNHPWLVGRDEITECGFRNGKHLEDYFHSDHVRDAVAPDIPLFSDVGGLIWLVGNNVRHIERGGEQNARFATDHDTFSVFYFLASFAGSQISPLSAKTLDEIVSTFSNGMSQHCFAAELFASCPEHDLTKYFGRAKDEIPKYSAVLKLSLAHRKTFLKVRETQLKIEKEPWFLSAFDTSKSFIALCRGSVVFGEEREYDPNSKPDWDTIF